MKKKSLIIVQLLSIALLSGCDSKDTVSSNEASVSASENTNSSSSESSLIDSEPSQEKVVSLLSKININDITSYDFFDRSYAYNFYNGSKYIVTANLQTGLINYDAMHTFNLYQNNFITDEITVNALDGVETTRIGSSTNANGQIYQKEDYIYDFFICDALKDQSFVECYEVDYYQTFSDYFNYLTIIDDAKNAFSNPTSYFPEEYGYETPNIEITVKNGVESYYISSQYPGDSNYKPYIIEIMVEYDTNIDTFKSITYKERSMLNSLDTDYEIGTSSLTIYTIANIETGEKKVFNGDIYTFDDISDKEKIHNAPEQVVDMSKFEDGQLSEETALKVIQNIYAYSNDIRQTNYSMIYHGAFDFADTNRTDFGNAKFEGKIVAYKNGITDNNGYIQKVDSSDQPVGSTYDYRIFTKATNEGIFKGGIFSKYITSSFGFLSKKSVAKAKAYLDANPLYWTEISSILNQFSEYKLGKNINSNGSTIEVSVSGTKNNNSLEIKGQLHFKSNSGFSVENIDTFTFNIENDKLMYCKLVSTGQTLTSEKYTDTYEARFVHASKVDFTGEEMDILNDIDTQIDIDEFRII